MNVKIEVVWGVIGIFVNPSDDIAVEFVAILITIPLTILNDGVVVNIVVIIGSIVWMAENIPATLNALGQTTLSAIEASMI